MAQMEYYSFERVLKELQMEEEELKRLVSEGEIRAFRDEDKMKFKKSDIEGLKKGKMTEPTIILSSGEPDSEDSEILLIEEEDENGTNETLVDIEDLENVDSSSTSVPTIESAELEEESSENTTQELTFEDDYTLDSSDEESEELAIEDMSGDELTTSSETFITSDESDTGLQTEPLDNADLEKESSELSSEELEDSDDIMIDTDSSEEDLTQKVEEPPISEEEPETYKEQVPVYAAIPEAEIQVSPIMLSLIIGMSVILLFSGMVIINIMKEVDTPITGWATDLMYKIAPAKVLYKKGTITKSKLNSHIQKRIRWREEPGRIIGE